MPAPETDWYVETTTRLIVAARALTEKLLTYATGACDDCRLLESEYILLLAYLGREKSDVARKCARYLIKTQLPDGGWAMYPGGKVEISASVKGYFALKLEACEGCRKCIELCPCGFLSARPMGQSAGLPGETAGTGSIAAGPVLPST